MPRLGLPPMPGKSDAPPDWPSAPTPRPGVPRGVMLPCGCILSGGTLGGAGPPKPPGATGSCWPPGARNWPGGMPGGPSGGRKAGRLGGGAEGGGTGGALFCSGWRGGTFGRAGFLGGGRRDLSSGSLPALAWPRMRLFRKSPEACRLRISNLRNSTIVATAQRITSRRMRSRTRAITQARIQCVSDMRSNLML